MANLALDRLPDIVAQAHALVQAELVPKVAGLSVAVAVGGEPVWSQSFGFADLAKQIPASPATRFRIGSVSKPLTAAGLALLVERGLLDLDAPVQQYIPDFPPKEGVITPRLLAGHLTGIRNYRGVEAVSNQPYPNLRAGLKIFENDPLEAPPRTKFSYSSYNWNTLGVVMETAAQQDFLSYLEASVLRPLRLDNTRPDHAGVTDPQRATFYETGLDGKFIPAPPVNPSYVWPAGGYLSTAEDLVRFGCAHFSRGFLKPESLKLLFTSQTTLAGERTHYGIGWFIGRDIIYHGGDSFGGTAILLLLPAARVVVAFATNTGLGVLHNALRRGRVGGEASQFLFKKDALAHQLAKIFAPLYIPPEKI